MTQAGLVAAWLAGRSLARGLPPPLADRGGWRVDTGAEGEIARWVFASPMPAITALTAAISRPGYQIRLAGGEDELTPLLADGWRVVSKNCMMVLDRPTSVAAPLPAGYRWLERSDGAVTHLRILAEDGLLVASGYAAAAGDVFVYDRILTVPEHRRRGLGSALMSALGQTKRSNAAVDVLTATKAGEALYHSLGWRTLTPWTAAFCAG